MFIHATRLALHSSASGVFCLLILVTATPAQVCGDCNGDAAVNVLDALRGAQMAAGTIPPDVATCDVDASATVTVIDALLTAQVAAGLPTGLACSSQPVVSAVTVITGPTAMTDRMPIQGGEIVEIRGGGFGASVSVSLDGVAVGGVTMVDVFTLQLTAPPGAAEGAVDVEVTNLMSGQSAVLPAGLYYTMELSLAPYLDPFTESDARHLYRRAAFGGTRSEIQGAVALGLAATVNSLVNYTNDPAVENVAQTAYPSGLPPTPDVWHEMNRRYWLHLLRENPNPFQERLAWFLHDHFAISDLEFGGETNWFLFFYMNLMRRFSMHPTDALATGEPGLDYDWRQMVVDMTKDRAMLAWLNGWDSHVGNPNENYARELWELFTLGEGNGYTETDIQEAARAFTGFFGFLASGTSQDVLIDIRYAPGLHDAGTKTILGSTGHYGYDDVQPMYQTSWGPPGMVWLGTTDPAVVSDPVDVDGGVVALTFRNRPVEASQFLCRKLIEFFLYEDPAAELVEDLAAPFRAPGPDQWNLRPVLLRLLQSEAMFSARARKSLVKDPVTWLLGYLRSTDIELDAAPMDAAQFAQELLWLTNQSPLQPPDVSGYPEGQAWVSSQNMLQRFNALVWSMDAVDDIAQVLPLVPSPRASITSTTLVDHLAETLDVELTAGARQRLVDYVDTEQLGGMASPLTLDPLDDDLLIMKTRGLLWLLGQHTDFMRN